VPYLFYDKATKAMSNKDYGSLALTISLA
jgi:hypothetical protein